MADAITLPPPTLDDGEPVKFVTSPGQTGGARTQSLPGTMLPGVVRRTFSERNKAGVPLDVTTGIPTSERLALDVRREPDQHAYLERVYGVGNVRKADTGDWIVRSPDPATGDLTDYRVDPVGFEKGDIAAIAPLARELMEWFAFGAVGKALPLVGRLKGVMGGMRDVAAGATGIQVSGAASDVAIRSLEGRPVDFGEIMRNRTMRGAMDLGLGGVMTAGGGLVRFLRNPFAGSRTLVQVEGQQARDALARKYGVHVELSPAELTGSPVLARKESFLEKVPGSSTVFQKFQQKRMEAMEQLQRIMLGRDVVDDDVIGDQAIRALQAGIEPLESSLLAARREVAESATRQVEENIAASTWTEGLFKKAYVGDAVRNRITLLRDEAKAGADALYARVRELGGDKPIFGADELADEASKMYRDLPPQFIRKMEKVGGEGATSGGGLSFIRVIESEAAEDIATETITKAPSTAFASETHVISKLKELMASKGQAFRLTDLQRMRREVYDDMLKGEAVPGLSTHYLSDIGGMLTRAIERGANKLPNGELKKALSEANTFYRKEVLKFEQKGVAEVFSPISEKSHIGPAELASRLTTGPAGADKFNVLKGLLGADSAEIRLLKRSIADDVIGQALEPDSGLVNAKALHSALANFKRVNPDLFAETFGKSNSRLAIEGKLLKALDDDVLPAEEMAALLTDPSPTARKLEAALQAQRQLNLAYRSNRILEGVRKGKFDATSIDPSEFVTRFTGTASAKEIDDVMERLAGRPSLVEDIQASFLHGLIAKSRSSKKTIDDILESSGRRKEAEAILGADKMESIGLLSKMKRATIAKDEMSEMAGAFAAGGRVGRVNIMEPFSWLKYSSDYVKEWTAARILTHDVLRRQMSKIPNSEPSKMYLLLSSPPFLRAVLDEFGEDSESAGTARAFMASLKNSMDRFVDEAFAPRQPRRILPNNAAPFIVPPPTLDP